MLVGNTNTGCGRLDQILLVNGSAVARLMKHDRLLAKLLSNPDLVSGINEGRRTFPGPVGITDLNDAVELVRKIRQVDQGHMNFARHTLYDSLRYALGAYSGLQNLENPGEKDLVAVYCPEHGTEQPIARVAIDVGRSLDDLGITRDDIRYQKPDVEVLVVDGDIYCRSCSNPLLLATTNKVRYGKEFETETGERVEARPKYNWHTALYEALYGLSGFKDFTGARVIDNGNRALEIFLAKAFGLREKKGKSFRDSPRPEDGYAVAKYIGRLGDNGSTVPVELQAATFEDFRDCEYSARLGHANYKARRTAELSDGLRGSYEREMVLQILGSLFRADQFAPEGIIHNPTQRYVPRPGVKLVGLDDLGMQRRREGIYTPGHVVQHLDKIA